MKITLRTKLILAIGIPLLVVYLSVLLIDYMISRRDAIRGMEQYMLSIASHQAEVANGRLMSVAQVARSGASALKLSLQEPSPMTETSPTNASPTNASLMDASLMDAERIDRFLTSTVLCEENVYGSALAFEPEMDAAGVYALRSPYACRRRGMQKGVPPFQLESDAEKSSTKTAGTKEDFEKSEKHSTDIEENDRSTEPEGIQNDAQEEDEKTDGETDGEMIEANANRSVERPTDHEGGTAGSQEQDDVSEVEWFSASDTPSRDERLNYIDIATIYNYTTSDWYLLPKLLDRPCWTDPYYDDGVGNSLMCTYGVPFYRNQQFAGVFTVDLSLDHLKHRLAAQAPEGGYIFLISSSGAIISHPEEKYIMRESIFSLAAWTEDTALHALGEQMISGKRGVRRLVRGPDDVLWYAYVPVRSTDWSLAVVMDENVVLSGIFYRLNRQFLILLVGLVVIMGVIIVISHWMVVPIRHLASAARCVANGDLTVQVREVTSRDELGQFAQTFNHMVTDLRETVDQRIAENAARKAVERELQVARQIQLSLLPMLRPPFPDRPEFDLYADNMAAKFIAGDFFDFWFLDKDLLAVVMADVSGKGVPAAIFMAVTRTMLRSLATADETPGETLGRVNEALASEDHEGMFVTLFFAHYHVKTGRFVYANAAHTLAYVVRADEKSGEYTATAEGDSTGTMCGLFQGLEYDILETQLQPGDRIVLYTDGVTEANHPEQVVDPQTGEVREHCRMFGEARLGELLSRIGGLSVDDMANTIIQTADEFRCHEAQDDVTVLVLKRNETKTT